MRFTGAGETFYVAGDYRDTNSIHGVSSPGSRTRHAVLADLTVNA